MVERLLRALLASTWLALLIVPAATGADVERPDIIVSIDGFLPTPGRTEFAQFRFENVSDLDATFNGDLQFDEGAPARVLGCEFNGEVPANDTSGAGCTVETAASACDQELALIAAFEWEGGGGDVRTAVSADFEGVGPCAESSAPPTDTAPPPDAGRPPPLWFLAVAATATATIIAVLRPRHR